jgi:hypothetical protein
MKAEMSHFLFQFIMVHPFLHIPSGEVLNELAAEFTDLVAWNAARSLPASGCR